MQHMGDATLNQLTTIGNRRIGPRVAVDSDAMDDGMMPNVDRTQQTMQHEWWVISFSQRPATPPVPIAARVRGRSRPVARGH